MTEVTLIGMGASAATLTAEGDAALRRAIQARPTSSLPRPR